MLKPRQGACRMRWKLLSRQGGFAGALFRGSACPISPSPARPVATRRCEGNQTPPAPLPDPTTGYTWKAALGLLPRHVLQFVIPYSGTESTLPVLHPSGRCPAYVGMVPFTLGLAYGLPLRVAAVAQSAGPTHSVALKKANP